MRTRLFCLLLVEPLTMNGAVRAAVFSDDFDGVPLQVGLWHATYSGEQGYAAFDNFALETP